MLLDRYEQDQLLFNMNFKSPTSSAGVAYRGELVIVPGDVADAQEIGRASYRERVCLYV